MANTLGRTRISGWKGLTTSAILLLSAFALCSCSKNAAQSDSQVANNVHSSRLSPEQCAAGAEIQQVSTMSAPDGSYLIQPGDQLSIEFYLSPEFNDDVTVRPDGQITLRVVGDIKAWGLTPAQLALDLDHAYSSELRSPDAVVHVKNMPNREVYVEGQVLKPGAFPLEGGMTTIQAISEAGGLTDEAANSAVLIRRDACGQPSGMHINVKDAMKNPAGDEDVALMPRDVIVVPRSKISNVDLFVKQYIQGLIPIPPYLSFPGPAL